MSLTSGRQLLLSSAAAGSTQYQVSRSLRFNSADSAYLSRTPASAGNRKTWTWSGWVKRSSIGTGSHALFGVTNSGASAVTHLVLEPDNLTVYDVLAPGYVALITTQVFRDPSAWYHIVWTCDTTQATASNRMKLYVNGTEITTFSTDNRSSFTQNADTSVNSTNQHSIGSRLPYTGAYFSGYLAEIHFIDGQALTPSSFAETDASTGQWIPKLYSGSFGSQGWKLTFADNSAATAAALGKDTSGNGLNWTPNNFSVTAGAGNDSLVDTPTSISATDTGIGGEIRGNYCTLNPLTAASGFTLSNGNLEISSTSASVPVVLGTIAVNSGKWYWEVTLGSSDAYAGAATITSRTAVAYLGAAAGQFLYNTAGPASSWVNGSSYNYSTASTCSAGDVIGVALNFDANTITFYRNGVSQGTFSSNVLGTDTWAPAFKSNSAGASETFNFGQRAFAYTAPSGFKALCDTNLTAPVIAKPSTVMDIALYSGNSSTQSISGYNLSPDFVWIKTRGSVANNHFLFDAVRGATKYLCSDLTIAEATVSNTLTSFDSGGFTTGSNNDTNASGRTFVAWMWDAGSSTVTNTQGSITSSVRANASAGFSVVSVPGYTYPTKTAGHGLGVEPHFIITKNRGVSNPWMIYHKAAGANTYFQFDTGAGYTGVPGVWSGVNSTVFPINSGINQQTDIIAYCFAPVAGYTSMGSYVGDGSTSGFGPFIHCGFRPKFILIKGSSVAYSWLMFDSVRNPYNLTTQVLYADSSTSEMTNNGTGSGGYESIDILSNGFQIKSNSSRYNQSGATYIYFAVAESPFQYARAR